MYHHKFADPPLIWKPEECHGRNMKDFKKIIEDKYCVTLGGYEDLYEWSIGHLCEFWSEMWDFIGVISSKRFDMVVDLNTPISDLPEWFIGAEINLAENFLKYRDDNLALITAGVLRGQTLARPSFPEVAVRFWLSIHTARRGRTSTIFLPFVTLPLWFLNVVVLDEEPAELSFLGFPFFSERHHWNGFSPYFEDGITYQMHHEDGCNLKYQISR
ncbi:acetoacetyl-CoA synthetase [Trichonephila clavipes]|nr:acetoacetyl-CoA synthetase [Trichonephila clavipes]